MHHDAASSVQIVFDTDNRIFGLPRELVVTVAGKDFQFVVPVLLFRFESGYPTQTLYVIVFSLESALINLVSPSCCPICSPGLP